jgi:hypothetical protein
MFRHLICLVATALLALGCARPGGPSSAKGPAAPASGQGGDALLTDLVTEEPSPANPVAVAAALRPSKVRPGETLTFIVQAKMAPAWHIYAVEGSAGEAVPTRLRLKPPAGVELVGGWLNPRAQSAHYEGTVTFRQPLRMATDAKPGPLDITCVFDYQACDAFSCRPPASLVLKASAEVVAKD